MTEYRFDPEVVALLEEIAGDPESNLLRLPKRPLAHWIGAPEDVVTPHASYLTKAEKHLAQAYREEAAWVLLEACIAALEHDRCTHSSLRPSSSLSVRASLLGRSEGIDSAARGLLEGVAGKEGLAPIVLASSAMRLAPSDVGRNCLGVGLVYGGSEGSAQRLFGAVVEAGATSRQRSKALSNMGLIRSQLGDHGGALERNEEAASQDDGWIGPLVWALLAALQLGDKARVAAFVRCVDQHPGAAQLPALASSMKRDRVRGIWSPTTESVQALPLVARLGSHTRELCDAFE